MKKKAYDVACSMEGGLDSVEKLARALMMMVESFGDDAGPIIEVARHIRDHARMVESRRGELIRLLHPNRAYFEAFGWPRYEEDDEAA